MEQQPRIAPQVAFDNIQKVVRAYKGTADEHDTLKESLISVAGCIGRDIARANQEKADAEKKLAEAMSKIEAGEKEAPAAVANGSKSSPVQGQPVEEITTPPASA